MIFNYSNCVTPISSPFCFNGTVASEADEDQSSLSEALYGFCRGRCRWFLLRWCPYAGSRRWRGRGENVKLSYCSINGFQVDFGRLPLPLIPEKLGCCLKKTSLLISVTLGTTSTSVQWVNWTWAISLSVNTTSPSVGTYLNVGFDLTALLNRRWNAEATTFSAA